MINEVAKNLTIMIIFKWYDAELADVGSFLWCQHLILSVRELFLVGYVLWAVDGYTELGVFCGIFTMIALSRGSAIHTLPQHHSIYS
jgi:hypothetical protein